MSRRREQAAGTAGIRAPEPGASFFSAGFYLTSACEKGNLRGFLFYCPASEQEGSKYRQPSGRRAGLCACASVAYTNTSACGDICKDIHNLHYISTIEFLVAAVVSLSPYCDCFFFLLSDRSLPVAGWKSVPTAPAPIRARGERPGQTDGEVIVVVQQWMCCRAEYVVGGDGESTLEPGFCCELNRRKSRLIPSALVQLRAVYWGFCH